MTRAKYDLKTLIFGGLALLSVTAIQLRAEPILKVIDIKPIRASHLRGFGNMLGLSFNPYSKVLYLAHGSDTNGSFIYTLDTQGNLLNEFDLQRAYQPGTFIESTSFDLSSG